MKVDLREKYSFVGEVPNEQHRLSILEMITADDYFPHNTPFFKKILFILLRIVQKVKNKVIGNPKIKPNATLHLSSDGARITSNVYYIIPIFSYSSYEELNSTINSITAQAHIENYTIKIISSKENVSTNVTVDYVSSDVEVLKGINLYISTKQEGYVCVIPCGDFLSPLYTCSLEFRLRNTSLGMGYANEIMDKKTKFNKPDFSPDTLRSFNYIGELIFCNVKLFNLNNGLNMSSLSSYSYSFNLNASDKAELVIHLPKVFNEISPIREFSKELERKVLEDFLIYKNELFSTIKVTKEQHFIIDYQLNGTPKVSIIIPTKNRAAILSVCLESIYQKSTYQNFEVIVIDNNSDEQSISDLLNNYCSRYSTNFSVIKDNGEFNFARLMNVAAQQVSGEYLLFLNNDTEILDENWLEELLKQAQRESVGFVGPKLLYPNNTIQHCGVEFGVEDTYHVFAQYNPNTQMSRGKAQSVWNYPALTAACFMVAKEKFDLVDGFDEGFAVSYNDIDLCLRLNQKGFNNVYIPHVSLYHYESISRGNPLALPKTQKQHMVEYNNFVKRWNHCFSL